MSSNFSIWRGATQIRGWWNVKNWMEALWIPSVNVPVPIFAKLPYVTSFFHLNLIWYYVWNISATWKKKVGDWVNDSAPFVGQCGESCDDEGPLSPGIDYEDSTESDEFYSEDSNDSDAPKPGSSMLFIETDLVS